MITVTDGTSTLLPFGLEFALVLAALSFVALVACVVPIAFEIRRRVMRAARLVEEMRRRADLLLDDCRRTVRNVGDLAAITTTGGPR